MTPEQRALRSRLGGLTKPPGDTSTLARLTPRSLPGYEGIPDALPQVERDRRAAAAKRLYFSRLALRSSLARKKPAPVIATAGDGHGVGERDTNPSAA